MIAGLADPRAVTAHKRVTATVAGVPAYEVLGGPAPRTGSWLLLRQAVWGADQRRDDPLPVVLVEDLAQRHELSVRRRSDRRTRPRGIFPPGLVMRLRLFQMLSTGAIFEIFSHEGTVLNKGDIRARDG